MKQLVEGLRFDAQHCLLLVNHALVHKIAGDLNGSLCGSLSVSCLQEKELAVLDRELHVLHVFVVILKSLRELHELLIALRKVLCQLCDRLWRADAGDNIFALCIDEILTENTLRTGSRITREGNAGARGIAHVSKDHRLNVDGCAELVRDIIHPAVGICSRVVPGTEDSLDGLHQLNLRILREVLALLLFVEFLIPCDDRLKVFCLKLRVVNISVFFLLFLENGVKQRLGLTHDDVGEHLDESSVRIIGKPWIAGLLCKAHNRNIVESEVQDGIHHAGHRDRSAGTHRDKQRVILIAELLAAHAFEPGKCVKNLLLCLAVDFLPLVVIIRAGFRGNRKSRRNRHSEIRHLRKVCTLAAEKIAHLCVAFFELVHPLIHLFSLSAQETVP